MTEETTTEPQAARPQQSSKMSGPLRILRRIADCVFIVAGILAILAWFDTADYRKAKSELEGSLSQEKIEIDIQNTAREAKLVTKCAVPIEETRRLCLLENKDAIVDSYMAAMIYVTTAAAHLNSTPDDVEVRDAALKVLEVGRANLLKSANQLERIEYLSQAHDKSILLLAMKGRKWNGEGTFMNLAKRFDKYEFALLMPSVAAKQSQWYIDNLPKKDGGTAVKKD